MNKKRYGSQVKGEDDPSLVYTDCKKKLAWYSNGVKRFVSEFNGGEERRAKMVEVQRRTWFLKHVKKAITEMKRCGWPMNMRNAAIALGIINSNGHIGRGKSRWSGDPEALMDKYVFTHRSPRHAGGRMAIVQKKYPIVTPRVRADFSPIKY